VIEMLKKIPKDMNQMEMISIEELVPKDHLRKRITPRIIKANSRADNTQL
jgi:hypothetical protein